MSLIPDIFVFPNQHLIPLSPLLGQHLQPWGVQIPFKPGDADYPLRWDPPMISSTEPQIRNPPPACTWFLTLGAADYLALSRCILFLCR